MYKNPQTSDLARRLRDVVAGFGLKLSHAQALEAIARLEGARTLHVAQARKNAGVRILDVARKQSQQVMFAALGRYEGNLEGLLETLRLLNTYVEQGDAEGADKLYFEVFRTEGAPILKQTYSNLQAEAIPAAFEALVSTLAEVMQETARAPEQEASGLLYAGPALDWRIQEGVEDVPQAQRRRFELEVKRSGHQLYVDVVPPHKETDDISGLPQMSLCIEVNDGVPCVHISNDRYGDQVLTVYATEDGLYLRPDSSLLHIASGIPSGASLLELMKAHAQALPSATANHCFIEAPNA